MSLIADALKAAQWERSGPEASGRRHRAASGIVRKRSVGPTPASRIPLPDPGLSTASRIALAMLVVAVISSSALMLYGRGERGIASASPTGSANPDEPTQRELAQALLGRGTLTDGSSQRSEGARVDGSQAAPAVGDSGGASRDTVYAAFMEAPVLSAPASSAPGTALGSVDASTAAGAAAAAADAANASPPDDAFRLTLAPTRSAGTGFRDAVAAQQSGDHPEAIEIYLRLLRQQPGDAEAANNLGTSYQAIGELHAARNAFRQALAIRPAYAAAWSNLSAVLVALGEGVEARAALAESIRLDPSDLAARVNLANQYAASGANPEARRLLQEVLQVDPAMAEAHYALARVMESDGDPAAVDEYRRFIETAGDRFSDLEVLVRERIVQIQRGG